MELVSAAVSLVARSVCAGCRAGGAALCPRCEANLLPAPPLPSVEGAASAVAVWQYAGAARTLILDLKLSGRRAASAPMTAAWLESSREKARPLKL